MIIEEDLRTLKLREDGRKVDSLRDKNNKDFNLYAGSDDNKFGNTKVICTASVIENYLYERTGKDGLQPNNSIDTESYWREIRESAKENFLKNQLEIQRLIGRALRTADFR